MIKPASGNYLVIPLTTLLIGLWGIPLYAQNLGQEIPKIMPDGSGAPVGLEALSPEQLLYYLSNEKVIAEGLGFISAQIGDPMSSVLNTWGKPLKQRKTGLLGSIEFMYQPDPNMTVIFTGQESVKTISVKGTGAALFRTNRGVRFGMTSNLVIKIYGNEIVDVKRNRAEYRDIGINFSFIQDRLDKIVVYDPDDS